MSDQIDWVAEVEKKAANELRWTELGYKAKFFAGEQVWVCPTDSQIVENPDVHEHFHQHLAVLHVPGPFRVGDRVSIATDHHDYGDEVTGLTVVDGVRHAILAFRKDPVPAHELVAVIDCDTVWGQIEDLDRVIHSMTTTDY